MRTRDIYTGYSQMTPRPGRYTLHTLLDIDEDLFEAGFGEGTASAKESAGSAWKSRTSTRSERPVPTELGPENCGRAGYYSSFN